MKSTYNIIVIFIIGFLPAICQANQLPFLDNEKLTFRLRWGFIPAGQVTLEVNPVTTISGKQVRHFILKAQTNKAIDIIYTFRERIDSFMDMNMSHSLLYKKKQSGTRSRDIEVHFDWQKKLVQYFNFGKPQNAIPLQRGTIDPLSALYVLRMMEIEENTKMNRPVTDGKKIVQGQARYIKREKIKIGTIWYDTYKLEPDMKNVKGVFEKSKNAKMYIWVTADDKKVLVKLQSEVAVGSFTAELISHNYPDMP